MTEWMRTLLCAALAVAMAACGGNRSVASRSAKAYDEAKKKGEVVQAEHHGEHQHVAATGGGEAHAHHAQATTAVDHSTHDHAPTTPAQHEHDAAPMPAEHAQHQDAQQPMDHSAHAAAAQNQHHHGAAAATAPPPVSSGLQPDELDAPNPQSVAEAKKAGGQ